MDIILYTTHCPKCNVLEKKLSSKNISYTTEENIKELINLGFFTAPILRIDDTFLDFKNACEWVNSIGED